jgi:hypothetical protein
MGGWIRKRGAVPAFLSGVTNASAMKVKLRNSGRLDKFSGKRTRFYTHEAETLVEVLPTAPSDPAPPPETKPSRRSTVKTTPPSLDLNKPTKVSLFWKRKSGGDWLLVGNPLEIGLPRQPTARRSTSAGLAPMGVRWDDDAASLTREAASSSSLGLRSGPMGGRPGRHRGSNVKPRCRRISSVPPRASVVQALGPVPASWARALAH